MNRCPGCSYGVKGVRTAVRAPGVGGRSSPLDLLVPWSAAQRGHICSRSCRSVLLSSVHVCCRVASVVGASDECSGRYGLAGGGSGGAGGGAGGGGGGHAPRRWF